MDPHEASRSRVEQAEAEGTLLAGGLGEQAARRRSDRRRLRQAPRSRAQAVGDEVALDAGLGEHEAPLAEGVGELASAQCRTAHGQGEQLFNHVSRRRRRRLWATAICEHQRIEAVVIGASLPLVVADAADAETSAGLGHVAGALGLGEQRHSSTIDNVIRGHGGGLPSSLLETTESTTRPSLRSSVQPQPWDRKP